MASVTSSLPAALAPRRRSLLRQIWRHRLDYLFIPAGFSSRIHSCEIVTHPAAPAASDHLPLMADVDFV